MVRQRKSVFGPLGLFGIAFSALLLIFSIGEIRKNRASEEFLAALDSFRSDFASRPGEKALVEDIIQKKERFIGFGSYLDIAPGVYEAVFHLDSDSSLPVELELQIAAEKGRSILASSALESEEFPIQATIRFRVSEETEIEPRVLYFRGNPNVAVRSVSIERVGSEFPWLSTTYRALLYSLILSLILLSLYHGFKDTEKWTFYLTCLFFLLGCFLILRRAWVSEDAYITLRHVDNLLSGLGPVFNANERVEGFTHPLWFSIISMFRMLGFSPKGAVIVPGLMLSFAALYFLFFKLRPFRTAHSYPGLNPGAGILIGASAFIDFGTSGLETSLSFFLLILYAKFLLEDRWKDQPVAIGLIAALLTLTRPDFAVFFLFLLCLYLYSAARQKIPWRRVAGYLVFPLILVGGYQVFRMGYYAALFPNPFYAKTGAGAHLTQGFKYLGDLFQGSLLWAVLGLAALAVVLNLPRNHTWGRFLVFFSGLLHGFFVVRGGGDFMHGRFLLPAFLLIAASLSGAFDGYFEKKAWSRGAYIAVCLLLFYASLQVVPVQKRGRYYYHGISDERFAYYKNDIVPLKYLMTDTVIIMWKNIGRNFGALSRKANLNLRIAYKNVGFTGYYAGKRVHVVDQLGLADPVISRVVLEKRERPGHEKHAPPGYLILRRLTFHETPFPLWEEIAATPYGPLWDLSPKTLKKLDDVLPPDFKSRIDARIIDYLNTLDASELKAQANFLFFLKQLWYPYAGLPERETFQSVYEEDVISQHSSSFRWIEKNRARVDLVFSRIRGPLDAKKFFGNIKFSLGQGRLLAFSGE